MKTERFGRWLLGGILLVLFAAVAAGPFFLPEAKLTVRVLDEEGKPVQGAEVGMGFEGPAPKGRKSVGRSGLTNSEGLCEASAPTSGHVTYGAGKDGHYLTVGKPMDFWKQELNRWQPWNPTVEIVLRKIVNPVPMYARRMETEIPVADKAVGFDLTDGDWAAPYGGGRIPDFLISLRRRFVHRRDYQGTLELRFSNLGDGIQSVYAEPSVGSKFRLPRHAPQDGYESSWSRTDSYPNYVQVREDQNYFFRVRSVQKADQVERALYGKIHGEIRFDVINSKTAIIIFTYYLNPDGTRNMEFDPNRNLFKDLKGLEEVRVP